jgi:2-polyprenyl-3-methyl-5-hydroxy-6-metoxy-1,4-benzoquinol methylase
MSFNYVVGNRVIRSIDEWYVEFGETFLNSYYFPERQKAILDWFNPLRNEKIDILDYGSGIGAFGFHIAKTFPNYKVTNFDTDFTSHEIGKKLFSSKNCIHIDRLLPEFKSGEFEIIIALELIEHIIDLNKFFIEINSMLRPNGQIIISTPNAFGFQSVKEEFKRRINRLIMRRNNVDYAKMVNLVPYDPVTHLGHVNLFSPRTIFTLLKSQGFEVLDFKNVPQHRKVMDMFFPETIVLLARKKH